MLDALERPFTSPASQALALAATRIAMAGLMFWWGLVKGLNLGVGQAVSDGFYGGLFTVDALLVAFGWFQVAAAIALALGLFRRVLLPFQLVMNAFVAFSVSVWFIDPFWLWMPGEKPFQFGQLFYPSIIVAAVSWLLLALREQDWLALDTLLRGRGEARLAA
ncbi:hypothetical protein H0I76_04140 [Limibaculum sp. M0105]|uniref:DoxX family protein n=1 Tax=Thermohalobaculum xanthum TaxID=2753746 RepID=A0A8J7M619_9RHOB|nr:hypothetical protein [Thermohalobaculum xanthum]MBK0398370.1 hypothetical protein [Thermohalobaculum xanthum]